MFPISFQMPNHEIKEISMSIFEKTTIKDVKIKLARESGIPWEELLILQYGTMLKNDEPFSYHYHSKVERIESSSFEKYNQQIKNLKYEVNNQKEKYEYEKKKRTDLETQVIRLKAFEKNVNEQEIKILSLQNQLKEAQKQNKIYENEISKYKEQQTNPFSSLQQKFLGAIENFFWPDDSRGVKQNQVAQQQDLSKLTQELQLLKQQYDDSQNKLKSLEKTTQIQRQQQGRNSDFDNQETRYQFFSNRSQIDTKAEQPVHTQIASVIGEAAERVTKIKTQDLQFSNEDTRKKLQQSAFQTACQPVSDIQQFDNKPIVQKTYRVRRISISKEVFEKKIEKLSYLDPQKDFIVTDECRWDCIRTEQPFEQKKKKKLYLMKKSSDPNELYVIKERLDSDKTSLVDAILQSRAQLITKYFMEKFIQELKDANKYGSLMIPKARYADIIILQDYQSKDNYLIAERYFGGESVKYNNNYGYILNDNTQLNHLAQAFTYYTYFTSNFTCMINNIQRVGEYFTDPVLNTSEGEFDENDMGKDGHAMFIINYECKRHLGKQFLDLLEIE